MAQFVSSGDCAAVVELVRQFERNGLPTNVIRAADLTHWAAKGGEGLILLGNGRAIPWLAELLKDEKFDWQIEDKRVRNTRRRSNPDDDFSLPLIDGIVARTFSNDLNCWLTIIAANHGRFLEAAVKNFSSDKGLDNLLKEKKWDMLPSRFDFKATVDLTELEEVRKRPGRPIPFIIKG